MSGFVDLHAHTTASDGSLSSTELVVAAKEAGLSAIAVTDHDTVGGVEEALRAGRELGLEVVPGVELSAEHESGSQHILGLFIDHKASSFTDWLPDIVRGRDARNLRIVAKLQSLGIEITMAEVEAVANEGIISKTHIAEVLVRKGVTSSLREALDRYLIKGAIAYCDRLRATPEEAIRRIHEAGGLAILAHPGFRRKRTEERLESIIADFAAKGLDGIEVKYSEFTPEKEAYLIGLADKHNLLKSGGTDFHGAAKPSISIGIGHGGLCVPYEYFEEIKKSIGLR